MLWIGLALAQYQLELTFDDEGLGTELHNMEESPVLARFVGDGQRTAYGEGRYGRAADLPTGASITTQGWTPGDSFLSYLWVRRRGDGPLVALGMGWGWALLDGNLVFLEPGEAPQVLASWPDDGDWHHLRVSATGLLSGACEVDAEVDFAPSTPASCEIAPGSPLQFGGFDGWLDEIQVSARHPFMTQSLEQDRFNRDPQACVDDAFCEEVVIEVQPGELPHAVPLRMKVVYDPDQCSVASTCPLLVAVQGGGACPNDYAAPADLRPMLDAGFVVATPDPYCEAQGRTRVYREELDQLVTTKDHVQDSFDAVTPGHYHATGCSHGADAVMLWALHDDDHPQRTFARSAAGSGICAAVAGELCQSPLGDDPDVEGLQAAHEQGDYVGMVTPERVRDRQIARVWGRSFGSPVCDDEGRELCSEEGAYGVTYASRRFRDAWRALETTPSSYFAADLSQECAHCAPPDSTAFACGLCMLQVGAEGMDDACPECLEATDDRDDGLASDTCPVDASWYQDPLATQAHGSLSSDAARCGCIASRAPTLLIPAVAIPLSRRRTPRRDPNL